MAVMSSNLVYEWVEWGVALGMSPEDAEAYNGQQGDIWDAHMDMLLAALGALGVLLPGWLGGRRAAAVAHG
jgi:putative membrane protein